jgi:phosphate/phosphite/phosphonate ABC transporter binding protein
MDITTPGVSKAPTPAVTGTRTTNCVAGNFTPEVIRIGVDALTSRGGNDTVSVNRWQPIGDYLTRKVGRIVQIVPVDDYSLLTQGLIAGTLHGAIMPPMEFISARKEIPCLKAAATSVYGTSTTYSTNIITRRDSNILKAGDLRGHRIAFVSRNSASGFLYAVKFLADQGIKYNSDYEAVFAGNHLEVIRMVQQGLVDAGATYAQAIGVAEADGQDVSNIGLLAVTGQIPVEPLVLLPTLDAVLGRQITNALIELNTNTPEGRTALAEQNVFTGWVATNDSFYDSIEQLAKHVDSLISPGELK